MLLQRVVTVLNTLKLLHGELLKHKALQLYFHGAKLD